MRNIKSYRQYINEGQELTGIDLSSEFDYLNDLIWDGAVRKVPVEWADLKIVGARTIVSDEKPRRVVRIDVSSFYDVPEPDLRNQLAHEMLHAYMAQQGSDQDDPHGEEFRRLAAEINKRNLGVEISIDDDVSRVHPVDTNPLESPLGVILQNADGKDWDMTVTSADKLDTFRPKNSRFYKLLSRDPDLRKYTVSDEPYTVSDAKAMELIDGAEHFSLVGV